MNGNEPATINNWLRTALFLPRQASTVAASIDHLHFFVIITTMLGSAFVGLLAVMYVVKYKKPLGPVRARREHVEPTPIAVELTIAGGLFALFLSWWVIGFMQYMRLRVAPNNSYDIYVTAKQWMWEFSYPEGHHSIVTLYVPTGRPVKLIMTSRDVIHSFFVPDFRVKQDVLPGRYTTMWFEVKEPGRHQVLCAEYCGTNHSAMRAEVIALTPADFVRWLGHDQEDVSSAPPFRQEPAVATELGPSQPESLTRLGEEIAAQEGCLRCHTLDGSPHIGPTWAGLYRADVPLAGGGRAIADEAYLTESMMDPNARLHAGYQSVMPSYLGRLRPAETAALLELIRSLEHVPGQAPRAPAPRAEIVEPAGAIGQPAHPPELPLVQKVPQAPSQPAPALQGLPPPGAQVVPPMQGPVEVGPNGPIGEKQ
jgi:cytochrome c oxidase subunit 2